MKCLDLEDYINSTDATEALTLSAELEAHVNVCGQCQKQLKQHQRYLSTLANVSSPTLDTSRAQQLIRNASRHGNKNTAPTPRLNNFFSGFAAASIIAVGVLFSIQLGWFSKDEAESYTLASTLNTQQTSSSIESNRVLLHNVSVVIVVPFDMQGAELAITLPENFNVQGFEGLPTMQWAVDFHQGSNVLSLPLVYPSLEAQAEKLIISAKIIFEDKARAFDLVIDPVANNSASIILPSTALVKNNAV